MADLGKGPGGPAPPLFLDQTEARRAEKVFLGDRPPPPYLRVWMTVPPWSEGHFYKEKCSFSMAKTFSGVNGVPSSGHSKPTDVRYCRKTAHAHLNDKIGHL